MEISEFTIRVILLFLPGIISFLIIEKLTVMKERGPFYFVIYTFILGFFSYFTFAIVLWLINTLPSVSRDTSVKFLKALLNSKEEIEITEVVWVSVLSIMNGFILSFIINRKYFHRLAQKMNITSKFGELDVWAYIFNSPDDTEWVTVRDIKNNLVYEGWVEAFSDSVKENELFIRDVIVFRNSTGERLYEIPGLYICRNRDEVTIEFNALEFTDSINRHEDNVIQLKEN